MDGDDVSVSSANLKVAVSTTPTTTTTTTTAMTTAATKETAAVAPAALSTASLAAATTAAVAAAAATTTATSSTGANTAMAPPSLSRSFSQQSATSSRSRRSGRGTVAGTVTRRASSRVSVLHGQPSQSFTSGSSVTSEDNKSLISFPSFSPEPSSPPAAATAEVNSGRRAVQRMPSSTASLTASLVESLTAAPSAVAATSASVLAAGTVTAAPVAASLKSSPSTCSIHSITARAATAATATTSLTTSTRGALFDDAPVLSSHKNLASSLHLADDAHIAQLLGSQGAVSLVRQLAAEMALRDLQMDSLRARFAERERLLRKIILECGLSTLDLETRLRTLEQEEQEMRARRQRDESRRAAVPPRGSDDAAGHTEPAATLRVPEHVSDLVSDAMSDDNSIFRGSDVSNNDGGGGTVRASSGNTGTIKRTGTGTVKGWKDFFWGGGNGSGNNAKKNRDSVMSTGDDPLTGTKEPTPEATEAGTVTAAATLRSYMVPPSGQQPPKSQSQTIRRVPHSAERRPALSDEVFHPPLMPEQDALGRSSGSRASSIHSVSSSSQPQASRKPSLASFALRLVGGGGSGSGSGSANQGNEGSTETAFSSSAKGRQNLNASASATGTQRLKPTGASGTLTGRSFRAATVQNGSQTLRPMRRTTSTAAIFGGGGSSSAPLDIPGGRGRGNLGSGSGSFSAKSVRGQAHERWGEMMEASPANAGAGFVLRPENFGPVEMDTILPPDAQPPTLSHMHNRYNSSGYLIDRFGFIYDQRRKKRQREAALMAQVAQGLQRGNKRRRQPEMLTNGRPSVQGEGAEGGDDGQGQREEGDGEGTEVDTHVGSNERPASPASVAVSTTAGTATTEESTALTVGADSKEASPPKRWQDYLKIATFPTELLSHTPAMSDPRIEIIAEGEDSNSTDERVDIDSTETTELKSPGLVSNGRGFVPQSGATAAPTASMTAAEPNATTTELAQVSRTSGLQETAQSQGETQRQQQQQQSNAATLVQEDVEPVRLLLQQLSELHDKLQKERTVRWNEFLRKVRAERRREGEAAAAAAVASATQGATTEARFLKSTAIMPETRLADGELIGVAGLGNKGKLGRAKWNEFRTLVLGGIPVALRAKVWAECTGAASLRVPGTYEDLVRGAIEGGADEAGGGKDEAGGGKDEVGDSDADVVAQIQADIHRTLTDNIFFREGPGTAKLNEVLLAYARRNRAVGYCQGMNLIAANLLLVTPSAEEAFWLLASIVETMLPAGYYDHSLAASRADQQVLRTYVTELLPRLSAHFEALAIDLETMTFQWFLSVFTDCLSAEALFRVWDVVFCLGDGSVFLFQVALALLKLNEAALLGCGTAAGVYTYINHEMTNHAISIDGLVQASEALRKVVRREEVEARREQAMAAERAMAEERRRMRGGGGGRT